MALVSVVIPAYNLEKYLPEALEDLRCQTLTDWEVIVVDDGSTDTTVELLKQYHEADPRITYIEQPHENAGAARNRGLAKATGKYVLFLDGDDRFEPTMMEELYARAEETQADIVLFDAMTFVDGTGEERVIRRLHTEYLPEQEVFNVRTHGDDLYRLTTQPAWTKFYRRSFLMEKNLRFQSIIKANDARFGLVSPAAAERIAVLDRKLVRYRIENRNSLQGQVNFKTLTFIDVYLSAIEELKTRGLYDVALRGIVYRMLRGCIYEIEKLHHSASRKVLTDAMQERLFPVLDLLNLPEDLYLDLGDRLKLQRLFDETERASEFSVKTSEGPYTLLSGEAPTQQLIDLARAEDLDGLYLAAEPCYFQEILNGPELISELKRQKLLSMDLTRFMVKESTVMRGVSDRMTILQTAINLQRVRVISCAAEAASKPEVAEVPDPTALTVIPAVTAEALFRTLSEWQAAQSLLSAYPFTVEQRIQWNHVLNEYKDLLREMRKGLCREENLKFQMMCSAQQYYLYSNVIDEGNAADRMRKKITDTGKKLADQKKETTAAKKAQAKAEKADQQHKQELTQEINQLKAKLIKRDQELETIKESLVFRASKKVMIVPNGVKKLLKK